MKSVKVYGFGWVGKSVAKMFTNNSRELYIHDPIMGMTSDVVSDVAFV